MAGGPPRFLVAKPGLDGHSNGAEQIAVAARDAGMEVIYQGIRLTPEQIAASARDEDPDVIGLSILSGSHLELVPQVLEQLRRAGVDAPVVVGGIIPEADRGCCGRRASRRSTRPRTSTSAASWARSRTSHSPHAADAGADAPAAGGGHARTGQAPVVTGRPCAAHSTIPPRRFAVRCTPAAAMTCTACPLRLPERQ